MDSNQSKKLSSDEKRFEERLAPQLRRRRDSVLDECTSEQPARIRSVKFDGKEHFLALDVEWPFWLPLLTGDSGDMFGTEKDIQTLQTGFRKHLLQQKIGRKLSNMLQKEFEDFLIEHLKIHRFGDKMVVLVKTRAARRLAGRPSLPVNRADDFVVRRTVGSIKATLDKIRPKIKAWMKNNPTWDDDKILKRISSEFSAEMQGWLSVFRRKAQTLPMFDARKGAISDVRSWRAREVAAQIAHEYLYRKVGLHRSLGELRKITSLATPKMARKK